jgi:hypothetical protein
VDLGDESPGGQGLEVAADGHVRDGELAHEVADPHAAMPLDQVEDRLLSLSGQHRLIPPSFPAPPSAATIKHIPTDTYVHP